MTTTVRARTPADLAVLLPYQLGYHPGPSVVLTVLRGKRLGLLQRHDLLRDPGECARVAGRALQVVQREGATAVILLAHEETPAASAPLREAMLEAAEEEGVDVHEHVVVRDGRWYQPGCHGACCPEEGTPLPRPEDVPAVAAYVRAGVAPFASREALVADVLPRRDEGRAREVALDLAALGRAPATTNFGGGPTRGVRSWGLDPAGTFRSWQLLLDPRPEATAVADLPGVDLARMAASLQDVDLRDGLMAVLCPGTMPMSALDPLVVEDARIAAARCRWTHAPDSWFEEAEWFDDGAADAQEGLDDLDHEELEFVRARLVELSRLVPEAATPEILALIAHLAWFVGDGTITGICLEKALDIDPDHRLAGLMMRLLSAGARPWSVADAA